MINELLQTVTAFSYDASSGELSTLQTVSTVPHTVAGNSTAEIRVHPSGKFVYGSNRGHDSIVIFAVDEQTGKLTLVGHELTKGKTPRNFCIDPSGPISSRGESVIRNDYFVQDRSNLRQVDCKRKAERNRVLFVYGFSSCNG